MPISISGNNATTYPTPAPTAAATAASAKASDGQRLNQNFDQFLLLLTTQLKNQDPLSPMDSAQFTNQLVSFSGVEQQIKMNDSLSKMLAMSKASQTTLGLGYIGLNVDMDGSQFRYYGAGDLKMTYELPAAAAITKISILDESGNVVYSEDGEKLAGRHDFVWNGQDQYGQPAPAGTYEIRVGASDENQQNIAVTTTVPGLVEGIQTADDGEVLLIINGYDVPMSAVHRATL